MRSHMKVRLPDFIYRSDLLETSLLLEKCPSIAQMKLFSILMDFYCNVVALLLPENVHNLVSRRTQKQTKIHARHTQI